MKKIILLSYFVFFIFHFTFSQGPVLKQWDYRYGSPEVENVYSIEQTTDSGFILIGTIYSVNTGGDVTDTSRGYEDMWVVKTDQYGIKEWDKIYGGARQDGALDGFQTSDGGYIFAGYSFSDAGAEKTQDNWDSTLLTADFWIVKTDSSGLKQWDKRFGGTNSDGANKIILTHDGQYLVAGSSSSGANGDKTQTSQGSEDIWVLKMDSNGNKLWDKRYGGSNGDGCGNVIETNDGSYLLIGYSYSNISGDKTDNNRDSSLNTVDYWIIKIDSLGNKLWDKTFGGNNWDQSTDVLSTNNSDYWIFGSSKSGISGERTIANYDTSSGWNATHDFWIIKIDSSGVKTSEKVFGGTSYDELLHVIKLNDGNLLLSGDSYSPASGDKSENNFGGPEETWIIKTDSNLVKLWDKTIFTVSPSHDDESGQAIQSFDGCIVIKSSTNAGIGGYKTQPNWSLSLDFPDYWIIKFCDTTSSTNIQSAFQSPQSAITISPNPSTNNFTITFQNTIKKGVIEIYNVMGEKIFKEDVLNVSQKEISLDNINAGIYFLDLNIDGERMAKKIVKQ